MQLIFLLSGAIKRGCGPSAVCHPASQEGAAQKGGRVLSFSLALPFLYGFFVCLVGSSAEIEFFPLLVQ